MSADSVRLQIQAYINKFELNLYGLSSKLRVRSCALSEVDKHLTWLLDDLQSNILGIDTFRSSATNARGIALATPERALFIELPLDGHGGRSTFLTHLLEGKLKLETVGGYQTDLLDMHLAAFRAAELICLLHSKLPKVAVHDISTPSISKGRIHPDAILNTVVGPKVPVSLWEDDVPQGSHDSSIAHPVVRACLASVIGGDPKRINELLAGDALSAAKLPSSYTHLLVKQVCAQAELEYQRPRKTPTNCHFSGVTKDGKVQLENQAYRTRIRYDEQQYVTIGDGLNPASGSASAVSGRKSEISLHRNNIQYTDKPEIFVHGQGGFNSAETDRYYYVADVLKGTREIDSSTLGRMLVNQNSVQPSAFDLLNLDIDDCAELLPGTTLNLSQSKAVLKVLSMEDPITIVQGPPGTGKTKVITEICSLWGQQHGARSTVYCVAASNVAVKNIAEAFFRKGFKHFKILVSQEFHFEWHEHLYEDIDNHLVVSDEIGDASDCLRLFGTAICVLTTLSAMSTYRVKQNLLPVKPCSLLLVDEASQICFLEYLPVLHVLKNTCKYLAFFGDDEQLPPYGSDEIPDIQSVFALSHLQPNRVFLDTQYRMPSMIADFISRHVYADKLKSGCIARDTSVLRFIDVAHGQEYQNSAGSSLNNAEIDMCITLAEKCSQQKLSYRIITPYEGQRTVLETRLKNAKLQWKDTVFSVDSFQGQEADYIILSLVRTKSAGFLTKKQRNNVMLTRCKKGMVVVTKRAFIEGKAKQTLVGKLASHWQMNDEDTWLSRNDVLNYPGMLPGFPKVQLRPKSARLPELIAPSAVNSSIRLRPVIPGMQYRNDGTKTPAPLVASHQQLSLPDAPRIKPIKSHWQIVPPNAKK